MALLPECLDNYVTEENPVQKPLSPPVARQVGLAVLDQRQSSPAALAFIKLAEGLNYR